MGRAPGNTASRVCSILKLITQHSEGLGVREISRRMGLPASTVHSLMLTMHEEGLLQKNHLEQYQLGQEILRIGMAALTGLDLRSVALPHLRTLAEISGTAATINLWNGKGVICVEIVEAPGGVPWTAKVGKDYPLTSGAVGKSILAFLPDRKEILASLCSRPDVMARIEQSLEVIRETGVALSVGEKCPGGLAIAAPVWNRVGQVDANLAVVGPLEHFDGQKILEISLALREAANDVSLSLGAPAYALAPYAKGRYLPGGQPYEVLVRDLTGSTPTEVAASAM